MADTSYLNWPFFEDHHRDLAHHLEAFSTEQVAPRAHEGHAEEDCARVAREFVTSLGDAGFLGLCVPKAFGGVHETIDVRSLCLARETLARHAGLADFAFAMQGLGSASISLFGTDEIKDRYLPGVASGERVAAFAISEVNSGSDVAAMATNAVPDGDDYVINGSKTWISNAGIAAQYVLFARTGEAPGAKGLSAFVVDADTPGISVAETIPIIAPHPLGTLAIEDCRVPASSMLAGPGDGFKVAMATLDIFRSTVGAAALGFARRALDEGASRAKQRKMFGQTLADFQLTQVKLAEMALSVDTSALLIYRAAWTKDTTGARITREASMAKLHATEEAQKVIDAAVQMHGGLGVVSGNVVEQLYRDIRALRIYEGASEVQKLIIGGQVLAATPD
ncbi:MAG: acyl-CoA dehydrogenase family protein [Rhodospirillales bacterium]|jgi:acyl-CoA dehydrogenase|nr:acyl-CoA dehydrogenase family protein [Rhodospirillales bacterium]